MKKLIVSALAVLLATANSFSQSVASVPSKLRPAEQKAQLPKVIIMGDESQPQFEAALEADYQKLLLTACSNDVTKAATAWNQLSLDMEAFAAGAEKFDLNGVKVWVHVLFSPEGHMDHVAYYLKPGSRFVKPGELAAFFEKFMGQYQMQVTAAYKFSQYGSLVFPNPK